MALAYWQYDSRSPVPCWVSGLAKRALLADSSGTAAAVIEAGCLVAAQNAEHAVSGRLTGTNQPAIAQIGRLAAFEQAVELVATLQQLLGGADIVGEQFKQLGVVHCRLFGVTGTDASSIQRLLGDQLPQRSPVTSAGIRN